MNQVNRVNRGEESRICILNTLSRVNTVKRMMPNRPLSIGPLEDSRVSGVGGFSGVSIVI